VGGDIPLRLADKAEIKADSRTMVTIDNKPSKSFNVIGEITIEFKYLVFIKFLNDDNNDNNNNNSNNINNNIDKNDSMEIEVVKTNETL
jgi:hypothetical protein